MRKALDALYRLSGGLAAFFIVAIVVVVLAQVCLNLADKIMAGLGMGAVGLTIPSYAEFTGYFLAASTFLALAYTLRGGGHIRVTLAIQFMPQGLRRATEALVLAVATLMTGFASWHMVLYVHDSWSYGDMSSGMVPVPIWIPQAPLAIGLVILTIALLDDLAQILTGRAPSFEGKDESLLSE
ncbi:TRAP transporter small permease [Acidimangrovimonas sediminis]|uniref:TRAP transporter small permease n=1 Tax=Acidimangrovimonas sediminis TaxID=2056283 RepID=UPI000C8037C1|nr:TRAP transporter small permease [Acidimangrovimonas sediminis]